MDERDRFRILIAQPQAAARQVMREYLQAQRGLDVVGEADNGRDLLAQAEALGPDLVLLEWNLPGRSGAELIVTMQEARCRPQVVVFGLRPEWSQAATDAGADAYVYMGRGPRELVTTIRWVTLEAQYA